MDDFLARYGGGMVWVMGVTLIALAAVFVEHEVVAAIFAFTGAASAILGVVLGRIEGPLELSATTLKTTLQRVEHVVVRQDLTLEEKGDAVTHLLTGSDRTPAEMSQSAGLRGERWARLELVMRSRLERNGWTIQFDAGLERFISDFVATREGERALVEVKAASSFGEADVRRVFEHAEAYLDLEQVLPAKFVLAVPQGALSRPARQAVAEMQEAGKPVAVWEIADPPDDTPDN